MCGLWELDECLPDGRPDVEKLAACCTEDVVFMVGPSSRPLVGREAAKKGWTLPDGAYGATTANAPGLRILRERGQVFG